MPKTSPKTSPKMMTKSDQVASMNKVLTAVVVLFFVCLVVMTFKYAMMRRSWNMYAVQSLHSMDNRNMMNSVEDASVVAMTLGQYPAANPIYKQPKEVQTYVENFSKQTHRDLVVLDMNKVILGDTIAANVGKNFGEDKDGEVLKTIGDGQQRTFTETSSDYPRGLEQTVVPLKDATGKTVGAVVLSSSTIFN
ncbi:hypothetical protein BH10PAT2_BH10PAT2_1030 [soil metagenome]